KVVAGAVTLAVIAAGISWWRMDDATRQMLLSGTGKIVSWLLIVLLVPWATFFVTAWVARRESNAAGAVLGGVCRVAVGLLLGWLCEWQLPGATAWSVLVVGALFAGVYNLLSCDWIAERLR